MFKLVIPIQNDIKLDDPETLQDLSEKYPACYYITGRYKDQLCLFVLGDLTTREYDSPRKLKNGNTFFPPKDMKIFDLSLYENSKDIREFKKELKLVSGSKIWVKPATLEPQVYSFLDDDANENIEFSSVTEYGKIAYSIYEDISKNIEISLTEPRVKKFIRHIVKSSYKLPDVIFDNLNILSRSDLLNLISAGLGIDENLLEIKKNT